MAMKLWQSFQGWWILSILCSKWNVTRFSNYMIEFQSILDYEICVSFLNSNFHTSVQIPPFIAHLHFDLSETENCDTKKVPSTTNGSNYNVVTFNLEQRHRCNKPQKKKYNNSGVSFSGQSLEHEQMHEQNHSNWEFRIKMHLNKLSNCNASDLSCQKAKYERLKLQKRNAIIRLITWTIENQHLFFISQQQNQQKSSDSGNNVAKKRSTRVLAKRSASVLRAYVR